MARALWNGSLSFGLVNVPVALYSAVRDLDVHFNQLHRKDGARIETRRFCADEDREVPYEAIGNGYDLDEKQVVLTDGELAALAPKRTRTIEIASFVDLADVDPILFDHPYWLVPTGESEGPRRAYRLLVEVMSSTDRVALGRFVMRTREYLVAVRVRDGLLALTTMRFADEVRDTKTIDSGGPKPAKKALGEAVKLLDALTVDWDPESYEDCYRKRLEAIVRRKQQGKTIKAPTQQKQPSPAPDLMEALRKTLEEMSGSGGDDGGGSKQLDELSREELYERAQEADIPGRSSMTKQQLAGALEKD
ncbi:MAG: end-binding protein Ku [Solirubrobacteraceae bacterium]|nr:end-binding protein Ku [Solirubrobacteraceae bacterium]